MDCKNCYSIKKFLLDNFLFLSCWILRNFQLNFFGKTVKNCEKIKILLQKLNNFPYYWILKNCIPSRNCYNIPLYSIIEKSWSRNFYSNFGWTPFHKNSSIQLITSRGPKISTCIKIFDKYIDIISHSDLMLQFIMNPSFPFWLAVCTKSRI